MKIKTTVAIIKNRKAAKQAAAHAKMIADAQAKIGPYVPVSYTQVWA